MATYYTGSGNPRDAPMIYVRESYPEGPILPGNMMMYMNSGPGPGPGTYNDALTVNAQQQQTNCIDLQSIEASDSNSQQQEILSSLVGSRIEEHEFNAWRDGRNEMLFMHHPTTTGGGGGGGGILQGGQNMQGQGLSLSLGTQIASGIQMPTISYRNPNAGFLNPSLSDGGRNGGDYMQNGFYGGDGREGNKGEDLSQYGVSSIGRTIPNSKYLKAAQQLLDEVVNVRKALKQQQQQPDTEKNKASNEQRMKKFKEDDVGSKCSSNPQESTNNSNPSNELSHGERQDLQNKLTKLLSMLDEVDRRYKQYYHQMQIVVSSFDVIAGCGAAKPYTALALQTISRHFRCLRDAITGQISATRKTLGEQDSSDTKGVGISRLRYVDQQLRQQRALQQLGMMQQHAWRPQRGLPESSVSILRAWLFEHFLHPYPKDSDKIMLARQTGLSRSQVSNWFINARVRLWKPMVEEMYKEEFADVEMDSNSSSENVGKALKSGGGDMRTVDDREEDFQQSGSSTATDRCSIVQRLDSSKTDHHHHNVPDSEMVGITTTGVTYPNNTRGEPGSEYGLLKLHGMDDEGSIFHDTMVPSDGPNDRFMAAAAAAYQMSEMNRFGRGGGVGVGSGVSLTLGLQHCEGGGSLPLPVAAHHSFLALRGDEMYNNNNVAVAAGATFLRGTGTEDFECVNPGNRQQQQQQQQHRFSSSQLLHDFVA